MWTTDGYTPPSALDVSGFTVQEIENLERQGRKFYGTLAGLVIHEGVQASAFDKPLVSENVYDGKQALAAGHVTGLTPVGQVSHYKVVAIPGHFFHPPRHKTDVNTH
jgi:hypothetical protein